MGDIATRRRESRRHSALVLLAAAIAACTAPQRVERPIPVLNASLTPSLAAELDHDGRFVFPEPSYRGTSGARADSIARAAIGFRVRMSKSTGGGERSSQTSSLDSLRACPRRYYVLPVVDRLPADLPRYFALPYAPRWVLPFCHVDGRSPLSIEVADAMPVLTVSNGTFEGSFDSQGEYGVLPSGPEEDGYLPLSPEKAAVFAAAQTGARVAQIPVAVMTHRGNLGNVGPAKCMRWRIVLDREVRLSGAYGTYDTREVYVRLRDYCSGDPVLQVADRQQKAGGSIEYPRFGPNREITSLERVAVVFAQPLQFDIVHLAK